MVTKQNNKNGDNIGRDKVINNYYNSSDYQELQKRIEEKKKYISRIPKEETQELNEANEALQELEGQEKQLKESIFRLYETFTKIPINTERLIKAKEHFNKGNFKDARGILDAIKIAEEQKKLLDAKAQKSKELESLNSNLLNNANEFLIKAQLTLLDFGLPNRFE